MALLWLLLSLVALHAVEGRSPRAHTYTARQQGSPTYSSRPLLHYVVTDGRTYGEGVDGTNGGSGVDGDDDDTGGDDGDGSDDGSDDGGVDDVIPGPEPGNHVGDSCADDSYCTLPDTSCISNVCTCDPDFVPLSRVACVPRSSYIGDSCVVTAQCTHLIEHAVCYKDRCLCEPHYYIAAKDCISPPPPDFGPDGDYVVDSGSSMMMMMSGAPSINCLRKRKLGESCCTAKQCAYMVWDSECNDGVCTCRSDYVAIGKQACVKKATALGGQCAVDSQCMDIDSSECKPSGTCWCNAGTVPSGPVTARQNTEPVCTPLANLGDDCTLTAECTALTPNSECSATKCSCVDGFVERDTSVNECLPVVDNVGGDYCTVSRQCSVTGAYCSQATGRCECSADYCQNPMPMTPDMTCLAKVGDGGDCVNDCQCRFAGSTCDANLCACATGYRADKATGECVPLTLAFLGDLSVFSDEWCCRTPAAMFAGHVWISPVSTDTATPIFTDDSDDVTIDTQGVITLNSGVMVTAPLIFTVTATSATLATLVATTTVELRPSACCTMPMVVVSATHTVMLVDSDTTHIAGDNVGCGAILTANAADNADNIVDFDNELYSDGTDTSPLNFFDQPCDASSSAPFTITGLTVPVGDTICEADLADNSIDWQGTDAAVDTSPAAGTAGGDVSCTVSGSITGCNNVVSTFSITLVIPGLDC